MAFLVLFQVFSPRLGFLANFTFLYKPLNGLGLPFFCSDPSKKPPLALIFGGKLEQNLKGARKKEKGKKKKKPIGQFGQEKPKQRGWKKGGGGGPLGDFGSPFFLYKKF